MRVLPLSSLLLLLAACGSPATRSNASVERDGSFALRYEEERDAVFHAATRACAALKYEADVVDPMAARISARSPIKRRGLGAQVEYYVLRADVLPANPGVKGVRLRVTITFTHHLSGQPRTSMNDRIVGGQEKYDDFFTAVTAELAK